MNLLENTKDKNIYGIQGVFLSEKTMKTKKTTNIESDCTDFHCCLKPQHSSRATNIKLKLMPKKLFDHLTIQNEFNDTCIAFSLTAPKDHKEDSTPENLSILCTNETLNLMISKPLGR